ncbi:hypothetical protein UNH65_19940 [Chitinophaga sp. 180180018-2]|jgi:hypothetical protein|nr:hypothetical protein [Chitinophaga sp. 212800010-3]
MVNILNDSVSGLGVNISNSGGTAPQEEIFNDLI